MNWPTPVPKMVRARPVTFWFARSVMVRNEKISEAIAPAAKAEASAMSSATAALELASPTAWSAQ